MKRNYFKYLFCFAVFGVFTYSNSYAQAVFELQEMQRYISAYSYKYGYSVPMLDSNTVYLNDHGYGIQYGVYNAEDGDEWITSFTTFSGGSLGASRIKFFAETYDGSRNCFIERAPFSGYFKKCGSRNLSFMKLWADTYCRGKGINNISVEFFPGNGGPSQIVADEDVFVVSSGAYAYLSSDKESINPKVSHPKLSLDPGVANVKIHVNDSQCRNFPLEDVPVSISSSIVPMSGGHVHVTSFDPGTGVFEGAGDVATQYQGVTDASGNVTTQYTAGKFGISETIKAEFEYDGVSYIEEIPLDIKLQAAGYQLYPLSEIENVVERVQGESGALRHPDNNYAQEHVIYAIAHSATRLVNKRSDRGDQNPTALSVNDIGLEFGGKFDMNGGAGFSGNIFPLTLNTPHVSHTAGVDFDINFGLSGLDHISQEDYASGNLSVAQEDFLYFKRMLGLVGGGCAYLPYSPTSNHFRCPNGPTS